MFFSFNGVFPRASIRTASGSLNGAEQRCVLIGRGGNRAFTGGRDWEESEYCVDAQTGLLTTYSLVPGLYVHYEYAPAIQFHGKSIPSGFTISENGKIVADAKTVSVIDPPAATDALFGTAGLTLLGVGRAMNPGFTIVSPSPRAGAAFPQFEC